MDVDGEGQYHILKVCRDIGLKHFLEPAEVDACAGAFVQAWDFLSRIYGDK